MNGEPNRSARLALLAALLLGVLFGMHRIADPDLFQHVAVGRAILADPGSVGLSSFHEDFPGHPYVADKWLASVIVALLDRAGGGHALMAYQVFLNVLLAWTWLRLYRSAGASAPAALAGTALTFVACAFRTDPRPDTLSLILLGQTAALLLGGVPFRTMRWLFPVVMAVWVNLHGYFVTGLLAAAATVAAAWLGDRRWSASRSGLLLALGAAACCLHPQGWRAMAWPVRQLVELLGEGSPLREAILEFQPSLLLFEGMGTWRWLLLAATLAAAVAIGCMRRLPGARFRILPALAAAAPWLLVPPEGLAQWPYRMTVALFVMAVVELPAALRDGRRFESILFLGFSVMALPVLRNLSLVPPAALMLLASAWSGAVEECRAPRRAKSLLAAVAAALVVVAGWARIADRLPPGHYRSPEWAGWGIDRRVMPAGAADFILQNDLPGPILNHFDNGGYLLYRLHPDRKTFIAGNTSMYPPEFLEAYRRDLIAGAVPLERLSERYGFRTAVASHAALETSGLVRRLARDPEWTLAFCDTAAAIFVRGEDAGTGLPSLEDIRLPEDRSFLPAWLFPRPRLYPSLNLAAFLRNAGRPDLSLRQIDRLWRLGPVPELAAAGASSAEEAGRLGEFTGKLEEAYEIEPGSEQIRAWLSRALYTRAIGFLESGDLALARSDARRAAELTPGEPGPFLLLARIAALEGDRKAARRHLRRALELDGGSRIEEALNGDPLLEPLLH